MRIVLDTNVFVSAVYFGVSPDGSLGRGMTALLAPVSADLDDDKFLACASAAGAAAIVSGDKHLLDHDGWRGIRVLRPRQFVDEFLSDK